MKRNGLLMYGRFILLALLIATGASQASDASFTKPEQFEFGSSIKHIKAALAPLCSSINVENISPITAPLAKKSQNQINCSGFVFGGKERHVELVFQDDQLDIAWILFPEDEKSEFIANFKAVYGEPSMEVGFGTLFLQANAAIRNEPSEVLFASDRQVSVMMQQLKQQQQAAKLNQ